MTLEENSKSNQRRDQSRNRTAYRASVKGRCNRRSQRGARRSEPARGHQSANRKARHRIGSPGYRWRAGRGGLRVNPSVAIAKEEGEYALQAFGIRPSVRHGNRKCADAHRKGQARRDHGAAPRNPLSAWGSLKRLQKSS